MAVQAFYLKYRPLTFDEVVGQEPIARTLRNALLQGRIRHAYLFTGPRGTGKTTTARLLAKAVNCLSPVSERPCNACSICVAVNEGRLMDLIEIDAASNRGIDEIRDIREKVSFLPSEARRKVYILDEAHMLTAEAFNALLKTLEEPPEHIIFVLVTTEPHKIPATIASRCQRFDFKRVPLQLIVERLGAIADKEGLSVEPAALELIARLATGAVRDAISLLDQLAGYGDQITLSQVQTVLGTVSSETSGSLVASLADGDVAAGLDLINRAVADGADPRQLGREIVEYLRGMLLIQEGAGTRSLNLTKEQAEVMAALAHKMPVEMVLRAIRLFNAAATDLKRGLETVPQLPLEMALVEAGLDEQAASSEQPPSTPAERQSARYDSPQPESRGGMAGLQAQPSAVREARAGGEEGSPTSPEPGRPPSSAERSDAGAGGEGPNVQSSASIQQIQRAWPEVLKAIRRRNKTTEGVLRSDCRPVEVNDCVLTIIFPSQLLLQKLRDPQRTLEIEEALDEVLKVKLRLKLILASEFKPRAEPPRAVAGPATAEATAETPDQDFSQIAEWAQTKGGQAKIVE